MGWVLTSFAHAVDLETTPEFLRVESAMAEGLPGVAAFRAEELLSRKDAKWSAEERETLATLAAEGWIRDGRPERVLSLLEAGAKPHGALFWRGQALLMQKRFEEAEVVLRGYEKAGRYAERARLCLALVFTGQGRDALARRELKDLRDSKDAELARRTRLMFNESELPEGRQDVVTERLLRESDAEAAEVMFLRARAAFQQGRLDEAAALLQRLAKRDSGGMRLHHACSLLEAEIFLESGRPVDAQGSLIEFLDKAVDGEFQNEAFDLLYRVRQSLPTDKMAELPAEVVSWMTESARPQRRGHALYLAADWLAGLGRREEATGLFESLIAVHKGHRVESEAMRRAMENQGALGHDARVLVLAEDWRGRFGGGGVSVVDLITGGLLFSRGEFSEARERFQRAADLAVTLRERRRSLFNGAVAAIRAGETAIYASLLGQLQSVSATEAQGAPGLNAGSRSGETAADLELDRALELAASGEASAALELSRFIEAYPDHARWVEAQIAVAELALLDAPPRVKAAETALGEAAKRATGGEVLEVLQRVAYDRMWCREAEFDWKGVTEAGQAFLKAWPQADLAAEVQMKVADGFFRMEDYANAQTQFELVAKSYPRSEFAEAALFLAGKAAMSLQNVDAAIGLWEALAMQEGDLSRAARLQQALAKRREGKEPEALKVVDGLLAEKNLDTASRGLLTCEKAELLIQQGAKDPKNLASAVTVLERFLKLPETTGARRARGGYWLAYALRKREDPVAALAACQGVIEQRDLAEAMDPEAAIWYYRAGFLAVELLEEGGQWEGAARMAERLAQAGGIRATEAKDVATKIRLERFLWDEKP
jgi:TolA-binding protein